MLLDVLTKDCIVTGAKAPSWQQAGRMAGQLLVDKGAVEPRYIDAMLKAVEEVGMYIVVAPGIALFHGRPEDGVKAVGLSLVTFNPGVVFGVGDKDPVRLAFALAGVDHSAHLDLLAGLSKVLQDQDVVQGLMDAADADEVISLLKNKLEQEGS